jgi:hypothetical protein
MDQHGTDGRSRLYDTLNRRFCDGSIHGENSIVYPWIDRAAVLDDNSAVTGG